MLRLNNLKSPKGAHKNIKRIGRGQGSGQGTQAGKGHKGQKARSGNKKRPEIRDIIKKLPKLRGRGKNINTSRKDSFATVKLSDVALNFKAGEKVTPKSLFDKELCNISLNIFSI